MKIIKPTFAVIVLALVMALSGCTFNTTLKDYSDAVVKTKALAYVQETSDISIFTEIGENRSNTELLIDLNTDCGRNLSTGVLQVVTDDTTVKYPMYISDDMTFLYVTDTDQFMKTPSYGSLLSNNVVQEYADRFAKMMEADKSFKNVSITECKNKELHTQTITFTIPSIKTKEMIESMITDSVINDDVKQQAVDQTVSKLKEAQNGQDVTEAEIKKIVDEKVEVLDEKLREAFFNLEVSDLVYTVTIDKQGIIEYQAFTMTIKNTSNGQLITFEASHTINEYNDDYVVSMPVIDNEKVVDTSFLNKLILNNMQV